MIARQCEADGVKVVALKGPALAALYPDPSWRVFGDLDLLVAPDQLDQAIESLARIGYRSKEPPHVIRVRRAHRASEFELPLEHPGLGVHVDLHWQLLPRAFPAHLPVGEFLARAVAMDIDGTPVHVLDPADQLVFLSAHGTKHGWSSLDLLIDVHRAAPDLEAEATRRAVRYGATRMLRYALQESAVLPSGTRRLQTFGPRAENGIRFPLKLSDSTWAGIVYLAHRIFVPKPSEWTTLQLPWTRLYPLYFPWRLLRTGWRLLGTKLIWRGLP